MNEQKNTPSTAPEHDSETGLCAPENSQEQNQRDYETSGLYPEDGKPFRILALSAWLLGVVIFLAVSAIVLDRILI